MSLVTRLALIWLLLAMALVAAGGIVFYQGQKDRLFAGREESLSHAAEMVEVKFQSAVLDAVRDVRYLAATPVLREFVAARSNATDTNWERLVAEDFRALLLGKPAYFQVRVIGVGDSGREMIRLDHAGDHIVITPPEFLQAKGERDYVREAQQLPLGAVHLSEINLNRDFGRITEPYRPTLRVSTPVRTAEGEVFGVVVINVNLEPLFGELRQLLEKDVRLLLANDRGDFIVHPELNRYGFGTDLNRPERMDQPAVADTHFSQENLVVRKEMQLHPDSPRRAKMHLSIANKDLLADLRQTRNRSLLSSLVAALASFVVIFTAARWLARRLQSITVAVADYEPGRPLHDMPTDGTDEVALLARKFSEMARRVQEDIAVIKASRAETEQAMRLKEEFLATMSHEIRTPLNAVSGLLQVLERKKSIAEQRPILDSLKSATHQLMALLNDALDYSKIQAGQLSIQPAAVSLHETLRTVVQTHQPLAEQKHLRLACELDATLRNWVQTDPVRLHQVLHNLIGNAVKFTSQGSVLVTAKNGPESMIEISVTDTGPGLSREDQARLFTPYARAQVTGEGTGLGLSITKSIVEQQGGSISLESALGQGSTFRILLPMPATEAITQAVETPPVADFSGLKLLYVEDIVSNQLVLSAHLEPTGARLEMVSTAAAALERLSQESFHAALLDLQLPDLSGLELAKQITTTYPGLTLIAVTAQASAESQAACRAAGFSTVVTKPIATSDLFTALKDCLLPNLEELHDLFSNHPARLELLRSQMADEFLKHRQSLLENPAQNLPKVRHTLVPAIAQLRLTALEKSLSSAPGNLRQSLILMEFYESFLRKTPNQN
jgi:two-component system, sensor histidine kinase